MAKKRARYYDNGYDFAEVDVPSDEALEILNNLTRYYRVKRISDAASGKATLMAHGQNRSNLELCVAHYEATK